MSKQDLVSVTKSYYDSQDADEFYFNIWGGEDIHVGIYETSRESIFEASKRTIIRMTSMLKPISRADHILDIGAGYGGSARYLAARFGCKVTCLNLSDKENERNELKNKEVNLNDLITVVGGNFEDLPFEEEQFDYVWSQDAILHSSRKDKVFQEAHRVLKTGGQFIFTDPMQSDDCPDGVLGPILKRIHLEELGSVKRYKELAHQVGLQLEAAEEMPEQLVNHYAQVLNGLKDKRSELRNVCSEDYLNNMETGLGHWINGGKAGNLNWGILLFSK